MKTRTKIENVRRAKAVTSHATVVMNESGSKRLALKNVKALTIRTGLRAGAGSRGDEGPEE